MILSPSKISVKSFFLKRFLFKPFIDFLDQRKKRDRKTIDFLKERELFLKAKVEAKNKSLIDFRVYLKEKYARIPVCIAQVPKEISYVKNVEEQKRLLNKTKELFIKGASDACRT